MRLNLMLRMQLPLWLFVGSIALGNWGLAFGAHGSLHLQQQLFHLPYDSVVNNGTFIGPFCCSGRTTTIRTTGGHEVGYIYYYDFRRGKNIDNKFFASEMTIRFSGVTDSQDLNSAQEQGELRFSAGTTTAGASGWTQAGDLYFKAIIDKLRTRAFGGRLYFEMEFTRVTVEVSMSQPPHDPIQIILRTEPARPTVSDHITFYAEGRPSSAIRSLEIEINGYTKKECTGSKCKFLSDWYPEGDVLWGAYARRARGGRPVYHSTYMPIAPPSGYCTISGAVTGPSGLLGLVSIVFYGPNDFRFTRASRRLGSDSGFIVPDLPSGRYKVYPDIRATTRDFEPPFRIIHCTRGDIRNVNFQLR